MNLRHEGPGIGFLDTRYLKLDASNDPITGELTLQANIIMDSTEYIEFNTTDTRLRGGDPAAGNAGFLILDGTSGSSRVRGLLASGELRLFANAGSDEAGIYRPSIFLRENGIHIDAGPTITPAGQTGRALLIEATLTEASSGNHPLLAGVWIGNHDVEIGDATVTDTANVYIDGDLGATVTGANYALWVNNGTTLLKAGASQTVNILELQASDDTLLLSVDSTGDVDHRENAITNFGQIAMKGSVEATISSGEITITEGHIRVDTENDDPNDDLDTINSTQAGEILFLLPADDARTVRIRHGAGNIFLKHQVESKSFSFSSPSGSSGTFYAGGYYNWASNDANLTQASPSVTHSAANSSSACHIGIVAGGVGTVDTGVVKITVSGTTIDDEGNRATSQTVTLVADITTLSLNQYVETTEKWIGQVTISLATASGSPVNFSLDINVGCSKYEDFGNQAFTVTVLECVGRAGANDTGFNLRLFHHSPTGWTYAATGFVPGGTVLANMNTDHGAEQDLTNGESFAYKRVNLNTDIIGDDSEGLILEVTTSANKAVEIMDIHFGVHTAPNFAYLATTKQHLIFMKHGSNWLEL